MAAWNLKIRSSDHKTILNVRLYYEYHNDLNSLNLNQRLCRIYYVHSAAGGTTPLWYGSFADVGD